MKRIAARTAIALILILFLSAVSAALAQSGMPEDREITEREAAGSPELAALRKVKARVVSDKNGAIIQLMLNAVYSDEIAVESVRNVRSLKSLRSLLILAPGLPGSVVEDAAALEHLAELHLQLDAVTAVEIRKLEKLPLRTLGLSDIRIDESIGAALGQLTKLKSLDFDSCTFSKGLDATFVSMPHVTSLRINTDQSLRPSRLRFLESFANLEDLWITRIRVDKDSLRQIDKLQRLEELSLQFTGLTDEGMESLKSLKTLRRLILGNDGDFTGRGLDHLKGSDQLEELSVFSTSFGDSAASLLLSFPKLNRFIACDTPLTDASVESLLE